MRAILLALLLAACERVDTDGPDAQGYRWERTGPNVPMDARTTHYVSDGNVALHCGLDFHAESCSIVRLQPLSCETWLPVAAPAWLVAHEARHCDGWQHPDHLKF